MRRPELSRSLVALASVVAAMAISAPAVAANTSAADPLEATLTLSGPDHRVRIIGVARLTGTLATTDGTPLPQQSVHIQRRHGGAWVEVAGATGVTGTTGRFVVKVPMTQLRQPFRAVYDGTDGADDPGGQAVEGTRSPRITVSGRRRTTRIRLTAKWSVIDEHKRRLHVRWAAGNGDPVPARVRIQSRVKKRGSPWRTVRIIRLGARGRGTVTVRPRVDRYWRAVGRYGSWWKGDRSARHLLDNVPQARPIHYPSAAPKPQHLPPQPRATHKGAHAVITRIPQRVWRSMTGITWRPGCPVGRGRLRLIRVNYWDFDGYRRRGVIVVNEAVARRAAAAFTDMYRGRYPIRAMRRVDYFGWGARSHGGNDYASMAHDNTSAFNCRWVTGSPGVTSPHSTGRAIDINTFENPYHSARGIVPDRWWASRSHPRIAWRSFSHPVVRIWLRHGFHWTYRNSDPQHLDGRRAARGKGSFIAD